MDIPAIADTFESVSLLGETVRWGQPPSYCLGQRPVSGEWLQHPDYILETLSFIDEAIA